MSDRETPSSSGQGEDKEGGIRRLPSQPISTGSSGHSFFASEPLQFRVRGSNITGASPPKFVTLEEIMKAAHGMQNMALAHEIAVDQDFKLEPFEPPDNSYQKLVKETMHKAYFDILREQLNSDPPEYKQALVLLEDVKQGLFSILLPRHTRIREMIEEVLDGDFIKQQAENNSLDFQKYASFVIDLMAKLAAPARDEMIQNITTLTDTVDIFRAILEALEVLKLDLANTLIAMIRPHVQKESVQYERAKFDEMLKITEDGLQYTREWLKRHIDKTGLSLPVTDQIVLRNVTAQTLAKAYMELLEWDESNNYPEYIIPRTEERNQTLRRALRGQTFVKYCVCSCLFLSYPSVALTRINSVGIVRHTEFDTFTLALLAVRKYQSEKKPEETMTIDKPRFTDLGIQVYRLICVASIMLVSPSTGNDPNSAHKQQLKDKIFIIIDNASNDRELKAVLPSVAEEVILETEQLLETMSQEPLTADMKELIRSQITSLGDPDHKVRQIVRQRILEFLKMILVCAGGSRQIPVGLSTFTRELTAVSGTLLRYVMHNKAVFTQHYMDIVQEELSKP